MKQFALFTRLFCKELLILAFLISVCLFSFHDWHSIVEKSRQTSSKLNFLMKPSVDTKMIEKELAPYSFIESIKMDSGAEINKREMAKKLKKNLEIPDYSLLNINIKKASLFDIEKINQIVKKSFSKYYISHRYEVKKEKHQGQFSKYHFHLQVISSILLILFYGYLSRKVQKINKELSFFGRNIPDIKYVSLFSLFIFTMSSFLIYSFYGLGLLPIHILSLMMIIIFYSIHSKVMVLR